VPSHDTYVALLHLTAAGLATCAKINPLYAYHAAGAAYSLGPATLFLIN
jgi:hypothetical protein